MRAKLFSSTTLFNTFSCICALFFILALFFLVYPVYFFESYNGKRIVQVFLLLVTHVFLLINKSVRDNYFHALITLPFSIKLLFSFFFFSGIVSSLLSEYLFYSWGDFLSYILLFNAVLILFCVFRIYPKIIKIILITMVIAFVLLICEFFVRCIIAFYLDAYLSPVLVYPNLANIRFLNQIHVQVFFFFPVSYFLLPNYFRKWIIVFGVVGIFMLALGGARGAFITIISCISVSYFFKSPTVGLVNQKSVNIMIAGVFIYAIYQYGYLKWMSLDDGLAIFRSGSSGRLDMWLEAFHVFKINIFGIGPYHYGTISDQFPNSHPHNFIVQIFLEWGLVAGIALCVLIINLLKLIFNVFKNEKDLITLGTAYGVLGGLVYSLFSGVLVMPASQMIFVVLLAILLAKKVPLKVSTSGSSIKRPTFLTSSILFSLTISLCCYIYYAKNSYQKQLLSVNIQKPYYESIGPRMWIRGGIVVNKKR